MAHANLVPAPAPLPDQVQPGWRELFVRNEMHFYIDLGGVRLAGDIARATLHMINEIPNSEGTKSLMIVLDLDCARHMSTLVDAATYDAQGHATTQAGASSFHPVRANPPGSLDAAIEDAACGRDHARDGAR